MYISKIKSECGIGQLGLPLFVLFSCCSICPPCRTHLPQWPPWRYNIPTFDQSELLILSRPAGNYHVWGSFTRPKNSIWQYYRIIFHHQSDYIHGGTAGHLLVWLCKFLLLYCLTTVHYNCTEVIHKFFFQRNWVGLRLRSHAALLASHNTWFTTQDMDIDNHKLIQSLKVHSNQLLV